MTKEGLIEEFCEEEFDKWYGRKSAEWSVEMNKFNYNLRRLKWNKKNYKRF